LNFHVPFIFHDIPILKTGTDLNIWPFHLQNTILFTVPPFSNQETRALPFF